MNVRATLALLTTALVLAACARTETPEEARAAAQEAYAAYDQRAQDARVDDGFEDVLGGSSPGQINTAGAMTPGSWTTVTEGAERMARYGEEDGPAIVTITCELGGGIDMRLPGVAPQGGSSTINISSPEGSSTFTASDTIAEEPETYISVPASDPFIGRLISGNGPFALRMGAESRIVFPANDILTSIVSSCDRRSGSDSATGGAATDAATTTPAETQAPGGSGQ